MEHGRLGDGHVRETPRTREPPAPRPPRAKGLQELRKLLSEATESGEEKPATKLGFVENSSGTSPPAPSSGTSSPAPHPPPARPRNHARARHAAPRRHLVRHLPPPPAPAPPRRPRLVRAGPCAGVEGPTRSPSSRSGNE